MGGGTYADKIAGYGPIAYWPLYETAGTVAHCLVNPAQNGTYNSDVATWPPGTGIGDGNSAPYFSGNDVVDVLTAAFIAAWNGAEGTVMIWAKVANAGVWSDGNRRDAFYAVDTTDSLDWVSLRRHTVNNQVAYQLRSNGVFKTIYDGSGLMPWFHMTITWSESTGPTGEMKAYMQGAQTGATLVNLGAWAGNIGAAFIGASDAVLTNPWQGWLAHCAVWDYPLRANIIADLATVP